MSNRTQKPNLADSAYYGVAGKIVKHLLPHTEADEAALLSQLLVCFGSALGRTGYFRAESTRHHTNLFIMIVGVSGKGRKGSSFNQVIQLFDFKELSDWKSACINMGLSSGEGVIEKLKDNVTFESGDIQILAPVDKRLLCVETEFANVLENFKRHGNTLSGVLRSAWDGTKLSVLTKTPSVASDPHVSIIGHITFEDLKTNIKPVDIKNGLGNRFLYFCSDRSKLLPDGNPLSSEGLQALTSEIHESYLFATKLSQKELPFSDEAKKLWHEVYKNLSIQKSGIHGDLSGRAEAQVRRIALILALLNRENQISADALNAALSIWNYTSESIKFIWGDEFGNPIVNKILSILEHYGEEGRSKTELINDLGKNYSITGQLDYLEEIGLVIKLTKKEPSAKKPTTIYYLASIKKVNELNELNDITPA